MNHGKILKQEIEDKGYKKGKIAEKLSISIPTLEKRLEDGDFRFNQIDTLIENRYIPEIKQNARKQGSNHFPT